MRNATHMPLPTYPQFLVRFNYSIWSKPCAKQMLANARVLAPSLLVAMPGFLVAMPFVTGIFLLALRPGAGSSILAPSSDALRKKNAPRACIQPFPLIFGLNIRGVSWISWTAFLNFLLLDLEDFPLFAYVLLKLRLDSSWFIMFARNETPH